MAVATITSSGGPGSRVALSPETIKVRDAVIDRCSDQSLEEMNEFIKSLLASETDESKRLGILAARVYVLRQRIAAIAGKAESATKAASEKSDNASDDSASAGGSTEWVNLRIIKTCDVKGIRFPEGLIVDVHRADAERLIASGNAELTSPESGADAGADASADASAGDDTDIAGDNAAAAGDAPPVVTTPDVPDDLAASLATTFPEDGGDQDTPEIEVPNLDDFSVGKASQFDTAAADPAAADDADNADVAGEDSDIQSYGINTAGDDDADPSPATPESIADAVDGLMANFDTDEAPAADASAEDNAEPQRLEDNEIDSGLDDLAALLDDDKDKEK
ncbi:hypothetical protein N8835_06065 [Alphaproteobacteria bacterium]|nr:hypothetical protein [Alphaproteobacteria bacterium]